MPANVKNLFEFQKCSSYKCQCGFETRNRERNDNTIMVHRNRSKSIQFNELFHRNVTQECTQCKETTVHFTEQRFSFDIESKCVVMRIKKMIQENGRIVQLKSKITNYDCDNIILPSDNNQIFRIKAVIQHIGDTPFSGHYVAIVRNSAKWLKISDNRLIGNYERLVPNLTDISLIYLEKY